MKREKLTFRIPVGLQIVKILHKNATEEDIKQAVHCERVGDYIVFSKR
jgi:hypothetical protein